MLYFAVLGCVVEYTAYFTRWQYTTKYSTALCAVHHSVQYTDSPNYHTIKYTNTVLHCTDIKHTLYTVHCTLYKLISLSCEIAPTVFFHRFNQPLPPPPQLQLKIANGQNYHSQCSTVQHSLCWTEFGCVYWAVECTVSYWAVDCTLYNFPTKYWNDTNRFFSPSNTIGLQNYT